MLKGVNKQIIEIRNPKSKYFESAILFVKADYIQSSPEVLRHAAEQTVDFIEGNFVYHKRKMRLWQKIVIALLCGAMTTGAVLLLVL